MEFTAIAPAANPSKLWRALAAVTLAAAWVASPAHACSECDPNGENDPLPPGTIYPGPGSESECRIDVSGPLEGPPEVPSVYLDNTVVVNPTPIVYLDVCGSWGLGGVLDNEITFAELEYYSDGRAPVSNVLIFTAARVNGTPSLVVDLVPSVPRGWSLTNSANQLPLTPLATIPLSDCKADIAAPFLGSPVEIKLANNRIKVRRNLQTLMTWPSAFSMSVRTIYPGAIRVMRLRSENATGSTVARTRWTFATE